MSFPDKTSDFHFIFSNWRKSNLHDELINDAYENESSFSFLITLRHVPSQDLSREATQLSCFITLYLGNTEKTESEWLQSRSP